MQKNIIICGDGTGMRYGLRRTNVARLFAILDRSDSDRQIGSYHPGVGTLPAPGALTGPSRALTQLAGLAVGYGLLDTVARMYEYLMNHYNEGDRIYLFGFSRGAFTVRVLAGLLHRCGLLLPGSTHLIPYALRLCARHYESFRYEKEREEFERSVHEFKSTFARPCIAIEFLGIWDTVKSFGYLWPKSLPHTRNNPIIKTVRHAVALNERRSFYVPTTWGGLDQDTSKRPPEDQDIKEVWFPGSHSDVGGGYEKGEDGLANISLEWMINEALFSGLLVNEARLRDELRPEEIARLPESLNCARDSYRLHPSLRRWWWLFEFAPRWELQNEPPPPKRRFKYKPSGRRRVENSKRGGKVLVHESVRQLRDAGSYEFDVDEKIVQWIERAYLAPPHEHTAA